VAVYLDAFRAILKAQKTCIFMRLRHRDTVAVNVGAIRNGSSSHEHYSSSPSKTLRAAMGCSFRFAGNTGRTKEECRIESLAGQQARARQKPTKNPPG